MAKFLAPYCEDQFSPYDTNGSDIHAPLRKYVEYYGEEVLDYMIFTILRNPWDRILSQYFFLNKGDGIAGFEKKDFKEMLYKPAARSLRPHSLLYPFLKESLIIPAPHGPVEAVQPDFPAPYWDLRSNPYLSEIAPQCRTYSDWYAVAFYKNWLPVRFENYSEEVSHLLQWLGIRYNIDEVREKTNATSHDHYSYYYDRDDVEQVAISCGADIVFFGYEFEDRGRLFDAASPPRAMW